jgi:hypothetical protein
MKEDERSGASGTHGEMRNKGKDPWGGDGHRWENNIKVDLKEIRCDVDWIYLVGGRVQWRDVKR